MRKIWAGNYLSNLPIEKATAKFAKLWKPEHRLIDIGCGQMSYKKYFRCDYTGSDYNNEYHPDIVAEAWDMSVSDCEFDVALMQQSLEHISETEKTVAELCRVLKPGGMAFITVPRTMKNHSGIHPSSEVPVHNFSEEETYWRSF